MQETKQKANDSQPWGEYTGIWWVSYARSCRVRLPVVFTNGSSSTTAGFEVVVFCVLVRTGATATSSELSEAATALPLFLLISSTFLDTLEGRSTRTRLAARELRV